MTRTQEMFVEGLILQNRTMEPLSREKQTLFVFVPGCMLNGSHLSVEICSCLQKVCFVKSVIWAMRTGSNNSLGAKPAITALFL